MGGLPPTSANLPMFYSPYGNSIRGGDGTTTPPAGEYGKSAQQNYVNAQNAALAAPGSQAMPQLAKLSTATTRYNPETSTSKQELILNAYGYAMQDIVSLGGQNGSLDRNSLANALGTQAADKFMKAEDLNHDGRLDAAEHTSYILFSDNAPVLMAGTLNAFAQTPNSIPGADPGVMSNWANEFSKISSKTDGAISATERLGAETAVHLAPYMVNTTLQEINDTLNVPGVLAASGATSGAGTYDINSQGPH